MTTMFLESKWCSLLLILTLTGFVQRPAAVTCTTTGALTVVITHFRNNLGEVSVALFDQEKYFPKSSEKAVRIVYAPILETKSLVVLENLPAGEYAVSVYHDENNNKKMDANFLGIPKEGVGASNNARGHMGPPKYQDAKFTFNGKPQTIEIEIVYL